MEEEKVEKKHPIITFFINTIIVLVILVVGLYLYSKYLGTKGIVVKEYRLSSYEIPSDFDGLKIIYFSDLLLGSTVDISDVENIKNEINMFKPDLVIFGGDLISKGYKITDEEKTKLKETFSQIDTKLGKYAILGSGDSEETKELLQSTNFIILENSNDLIYAGESEPICLIGINSYVLGKYEIDNSVKCESNYKIAISHEPDIINMLGNLDIDVFLSGNSLGGEINIPFYGSLEKFEGSNKYFKDTKVGNINVFISSGVGTKKQAMRLFNKPSFNLFRLKHEEQNS